ncbi:MAG: thiosulfate oxidation carrier protein SoxY [Pseudomonadota bacterium]
MASRRTALKAGLAVAATPLIGWTLPTKLDVLLREAFGARPIQAGKVSISLPALAENGNSVPITVAVDSPMNKVDRVHFLQLFAPQNPVPRLARFEFSAASGVAEVETRIRIADEQDVVAVAGLADGSLWRGAAHIVVTEAACIDALI